MIRYEFKAVCDSCRKDHWIDSGTCSPQSFIGGGRPEFPLVMIPTGWAMGYTGRLWCPACWPSACGSDRSPIPSSQELPRLRPLGGEAQGIPGLGELPGKIRAAGDKESSTDGLCMRPLLEELESRRPHDKCAFICFCRPCQRARFGGHLDPG